MYRRIALHGALLGFGYFALSAVVIRFARFDGGVAFVWFANALLLGKLLNAPRRDWPVFLFCCFFGSMAATIWSGLPLASAIPLASLLMLEAVCGTVLLQYFGITGYNLAGLKQVWLFALIVGVVSPALVAIPISVLIQGLTGAAFFDNWLRWTLAHGLGTMTLAPVVSWIFSGEIRRWFAANSPVERWAAMLMLSVMVAITFGVFGQNRWPLLFLPIVPMMVAAFRFEFIGAAGSTLALVLIGGTLTVYGDGPMQLLHAGRGEQILFLQFYIVCCMLIALPVATELQTRRHTFQKLRESEARFRLLAERSIDVVLNIDRGGVIRYVSPSVQDMMGVQADALIGLSVSDLAEAGDGLFVPASIEDVLALGGMPHRTQMRLRNVAGEPFWCEAYSRAVRDEAGHLTGVVSSLRDISQYKEIELTLSSAANTDILTNLPNRRAFDEALDRCVGDARQRSGGYIWLALIDLDNFKQVNDRWGHDAGDHVLRHFADIARGLIRPDDFLARFGGEEFALLLRNVDAAMVRGICDRLRGEIEDSAVHAISGGPIRITMSAGIALVDGRAPTEILRAADQALYRAKRAGRNRLELAA
ncbi:sensor domain-containing diguanylate cyclase [Flavisphingomonas formosensis]|uniref:sensor domain-containing diguanylate cyclase n=1 Tax=Flavisphingomonas formosensis TaxID=861534 RepID=UPI0018E00AB9|nr:sensor domain-containing diguanylate cyclase [Sphingomonas formosensis]